jgi:hypothetical protein
MLGRFGEGLMSKYLALVCGLIFLSTPVAAQTPTYPIQQTFPFPGQVSIAGTDGNTSGIASNIVLKLTRDYTTNNQLVTYWDLTYQYYNGAFRWEYSQNLYIDFVDSVGTVLVNSPALTSQTPARNCHYGPGVQVHNTGTMTFDFTLVHDMHITGSGATLSGGKPGEDHKC